MVPGISAYCPLFRTLNPCASAAFANDTTPLSEVGPTYGSFEINKFPSISRWSASSATCDAALIKKTYLANFRKHRQSIEDAARTLGAEFVEFRTDQPLDESIVSFLRRRAGTV